MKAIKIDFYQFKEKESQNESQVRFLSFTTIMYRQPAKNIEMLRKRRRKKRVMIDMSNRYKREDLENVLKSFYDDANYRDLFNKLQLL